MMIIFGIILGLLILMLLVTLHEFGHFIMARRSGVKVNEFGIGFPPRAIAWTKKDGKWTKTPKSDWGKSQESQENLIFSLNWLPIGGFCSMDGESDADTKPGTFGAASFWGKTKILFGGVLMNWLVAFVILTVLAFTGMPQFLSNQFGHDQFKPDATVLSAQGVIVAGVIEGSPADRAGIKKGDYIDMLDQENSADYQGPFFPEDIIAYGRDHAGQTGHYCISTPTVAPDCRWLDIELNDSDADYQLGASLGFSQAKIRYTWSAPLVAAGTTVQLTAETFKGLGELLWNLCKGVVQQFSFDSTIREEGQAAIGTVGDSVSGPVGIIGNIFPAFVSSGPANLAFLAALISVSLACMNVLPIPALDGGRWLLIAIFRLRGKTLSKETETKIVSRAFTVLLILIAIITVLDIIKLF